MKDYCEMSDFDINVGVMKLTCKYKGFYDREARFSSHVNWNDGYSWRQFDPCNSWADAGPIIQQYRISISFDGSDDGDEYSEWVAACSLNEEHFVDYQHCDKALRAAMIVFLMMQEIK